MNVLNHIFSNTQINLTLSIYSVVYSKFPHAFIEKNQLQFALYKT